MNRRSFLIGAIAAPIAAKLPPVDIVIESIAVPTGGNYLITLECITKEAIRLFQQQSVFLQSINSQYDEAFK